ncbi:MAG: phytanoyl-CoA dioxygenase family protein [Caldilineaceae bacterium]
MEKEQDQGSYALRQVEPLIDLSPTFAALTKDRRIVGPLEQIYGETALLFEDKLNYKPARVGSGFNMHQDSSYWTDFSRNIISVFIHLDDATQANGCLEVVPGFHQQGLVNWTGARDHTVRDERITRATRITVEAKAGDVLLFHCLTPHASGPNRTDRGRRALVLSYNPASDGNQYRYSASYCVATILNVGRCIKHTDLAKQPLQHREDQRVMGEAGYHTYREITSQTAAWRVALADFGQIQPEVQARWRVLNPSTVLCIGCGSTYYLAQIAAHLIQSLTGRPARLALLRTTAFDADTLLDPQRTLLLTISRSGTTTETVAATARFRERGGAESWTICCNGSSPLAQGADLALLAESAQEQSMAQARSFSTMLLLAQALATTIAGLDLTMLQGLPACGDQLLAQSAPLMAVIGGQRPWERAFYLGSGLHYGLACEVMLKLQEMALTDSQGYHFLEFRHGPKSMVDDRTLVVGLLGNGARRHEIPVLQEMAALGGQILAVNSSPTAAFPDTIDFGESLPAWASPVLYLPALQLLAYHRALSKG